ncbi:MAG TPA: bifunctional riboflavin kinase/FAD synthetase [Polyangiaceae bacterium]|nr:bifunctional riboflavin kinase/FAD synthetase [Polyangiaceae bacterium]
MSQRAALQILDDATPPGPVAAEACVLVIGNFDGVHRGHQSVLTEAVEAARAQGLVPSVLTFDPHPAAVVGGGAPPVLTTLERRAELMGELGVERVYARRFDADFAGWGPERFARELVVEALRARAVVVGQNFRFGTKRAGDLALLRSLGAELGFEVRVHGIARDEKGPFSSTRAREAIAAGTLDEAERVLGRPHSLSGVVVHGQERGRTINVPTANIAPVAEMLPLDGVYAVRAELLEEDGEVVALPGGVTNIGVRPTVDGTSRTVETYLLGFAGDLYDQRLRVHLVARLRGEQKFAGLEELKAQITRDCLEARRKLGLPTE